MNKGKLQQKQAKIRKYLGNSKGSRFILKQLGNTSYKNKISRCGVQEADRLLEIIKKLPKMSKFSKNGWGTLSNAEIHFGQPLSEYIEKLNKHDGFKIIRDEKDIVLPIVKTKVVSEILGIKPHFIGLSEVDEQLKHRPRKFLKDSKIQELHFCLWNSKDVHVYDRNVVVPFIKKYVEESGKRSKTNNNKKRYDDDVSPEGRIYNKQLKLSKLLGTQKKNRFILSLLGYKGYRYKINKGKENDIDQMLEKIDKIPIKQDIPSGWETLSSAETHFGEPLVNHVNKLKNNKAFKLIRNFDGVVTPIIHIKNASKSLRIKPHFVDAFELFHVHNFPYAISSLMLYLRDGKIPERRFKRWDAHNIVTFDADFAIPFLQNLMSMENRAGKRKTTLNRKLPNKQQRGGWKAKTDDDWKYSWKEQARIYRESHPQQD